jgi:hypothetical protein
MVKFPSEGELRSMTMPMLKTHVRDFNEHYAIRGYSKLKKDQLISAILTAQMRAGKKTTPPTPKPKTKSVDLSKLTKAQLLKMLPESVRGGEVAKLPKAKLIEAVKGVKKFKTKNQGKKQATNPVEINVLRTAVREHNRARDIRPQDRLTIVTDRDNATPSARALPVFLLSQNRPVYLNKSSPAGNNNNMEDALPPPPTRASDIRAVLNVARSIANN